MWKKLFKIAGIVAILEWVVLGIEGLFLKYFDTITLVQAAIWTILTAFFFVMHSISEDKKSINE